MIPLIITSINSETKAINKLKSLPDCRLIIVGDLKTPTYDDVEIDFLSVERQKELYPDLSDILPFNHYCRKNIGYVHALKNLEFDKLIETDDDNIPYDNWLERFSEASFKEHIYSDRNWINVYRFFTDKLIWPRGLPLEEIKAEHNFVRETVQNNVGVIQGLADGDPDVDSVFRMVLGGEITFSWDEFAIGANTYSPFNSQNTLWRKELLALAYLPSKVTFRYTDILRGMVAQRVLWEKGYTLGFIGASVFQERNEHSLIKDFTDEVPMFLEQNPLVARLASMDLSSATIGESMISIYQNLEAAGIVGTGEVAILQTFLEHMDA